VTDLETGAVTVSGTDGRAAAGKYVTLSVLKPGGVASASGITTDNYDGVLYMVDQTVTDANGRYAFQFPMDDSALQGEYKAVVAFEGLKIDESFRSDSFYFGAVRLVDGAGNDVKNLTPGMRVKAVADLASLGSIDEATLILAVYHNGKLVKVIAEREENPSVNTNLSTTDYALPQEVIGYRARAMLWSSLNNLKPLAGYAGAHGADAPLPLND
jgi:hypothetical protein